MSASENIALVRRFYESKVAPEVFQEVMDPELVWDITPGFPGGRVYHGPESVGRDFFDPLMENFDTFYPVGEEYFADGEDHVFALGHYHTVSRRGATADARFMHLWTVRDGRFVKLQQVSDTLVVDRVING
ncbi:nuclear transport factor 2 family protein [Streptomyces sp. NPDC058683]|uniref:nuclear transport factor 2 family protein n=1 Tax=Streptomyces sp. NPDC058683 TaxID=3346597 RepID=UPI003646CB64